MPELGTYGSVRGALSNQRPYRDSGAPLSIHLRTLALGCKNRFLKKFLASCARRDHQFR
jgi:hypothetical protein